MAGPVQDDYFDRVAGEHYTVVLRRLHAFLRPRRYLEIGIGTGEAVALSACASIAVDPQSALDWKLLQNKPECRVYQQSSDDFFRQHDPRALLGGDVDLVFLHGVHLFENVLLDFIHSERACGPNSVIVVHNCVPGDEFISARDPAARARSRRAGWWTGDVWKLIPVLRRSRPDIRMVVLDAQPAGLLLCAGLDPKSRPLGDACNALVSEFVPLTLREYDVEKFFDSLDLLPTASLISRDDLRRTLGVEAPEEGGREPRSVGPAVYRFRDPLTFPRIAPSDLVSGPEGVWLEPPGTQTTRLRPVPAFHDHPDGKSIFDVSLSQRVHVVHPPAFVLARDDATLVGHRALLGADGTFCTDEAFVEPLSRERALNRLAGVKSVDNEDTGLTREADNEVFRLERRGRAERRFEEPVIVLCSGEPSNYGSFLFRVLPKLTTVLDAGLAERILVPLYSHTRAQLLKLCDVDEGRIILHDPNAIYRIQRALFVALRNTQAFLDDATVAFYARLRQRYGAASGGRRLFVTRRDAGNARRKLVNEDEVVEMLARHGFEVVEPSRLPALEQIRLFSAADVIVGQSGSAMFNTVFCRPGTTLIDIESEPHWIHAHMCLFGSLGLNFGIFEGDPVDRDWRVVHKAFGVDVGRLEQRLRKCLG